MNCRHVLDLIDADAMADYPPDHLRAAWRHARACPTCGPALDAATALTRELAGLSDTEPPTHFAASVAARIARIDMPLSAGSGASRARPTRAVAGWWPVVSTSVGGVTAAVTFMALLPAGVWTAQGFEALWAGWMGAELLVRPPSAAELLALTGGVVLFVVGMFLPTSIEPHG